MSYDYEKELRDDLAELGEMKLFLGLEAAVGRLLDPIPDHLATDYEEYPTARIAIDRYRAWLIGGEE